VHGSHYSGDAGSNYGIGTRRRSALMRTWFQIDVESRSPGPLASLLDRQNLGVPYARVSMTAAADDHAVRVNKHGSHIRVGRSQTNARSRQLKRLAKKLLIDFVRKRHVDWFSP
jgi:hypothetical protein